MIEEILRGCGGLGLFLVGMILLTEGLSAAAGDSLKRLLAKWTRSPTSGALLGAAVTAAVQSSGIVTVATVGFVGAGLLSFSQALGVVFGANVGSTLTGWWVAVLGFKLNVAALASPVLLLGALIRLFGRGRWPAAGLALAGLSLVFLGFALLQDGLAALSATVTPDAFPRDTFGGRLLLVLIGALLAIVVRSSGAGVATALAALHAGTISFPQAAAMVIGMDVGTTLTAFLAALGGSVQMRRTGLAHVVFNLFTAAGALLLLPLFVRAVQRLGGDLTAREPELTLVAFHSTFNLLGLLVVLPFTQGFARLIVRLVPQRGPQFTRRLDPSLRQDPLLALAAVHATLEELFSFICRTFAAALADPAAPADHDARRLDAVADALQETRQYLAGIAASPDRAGVLESHESLYHVVDHLGRLLRRIRAREAAGAGRGDQRLAAARTHLREMLASGADGSPAGGAARARENWEWFVGEDESYRRVVLRETAVAAPAVDASLARLDEMRRLRRVSYHVWRVADHLAAPRGGAGTAGASG